LRVLTTLIAFLGFALHPERLYGQTAPLRVLVSNGMKGAFQELKPQAERDIGRSLEFQFHSTTGIKQQIQAGDAFDAVVITVEAIEELIHQGKLTTAGRTELGRSELGIGIRSGAVKPDIKTPNALAQTLRSAESISYPKDGASREYVEAMFDKLGIRAAVKQKIILANGSGPATESVASGKAALVITLFSEIVPVKGVEILGPLPGEYHYDIHFAAAAARVTKDPEGSQKLIQFLVSRSARAVFKTKGVEPN
jgi:molybdate transport system substrate-binding protein